MNIPSLSRKYNPSMSMDKVELSAIYFTAVRLGLGDT
jgi:hypothetical protein